MVDRFKHKSNPTKHIKDISPLKQLVGKKAIDQYVKGIMEIGNNSGSCCVAREGFSFRLAFF